MILRRSVDVATPLGPDALLFRRMTAVEELGRPFEVQLELLSSDEGISFDDLLGQPMTVRLGLAGGRQRFFHGLVARFSQVGREGSFAAYRATLRPWLWLLTRAADCRIFQGKTVPEIVKEVFRGHGFTDFDQALSGHYEPREYCVQYRETDFAFVSRLLEQEGIYYFFRHEVDKHTLVLADAYSAHEAVTGYESIPYYPPEENVVRDEDHVFEWLLSREVQPGICALTDFDFEKPKAGLLVKAPGKGQHAHADFEVFDYPGDYGATDLGDVRARTRMEEYRAKFERARGRGTPRGLAVGSLFELTLYPRKDQNREYLVVSATHRVESEAYESGAAGASGPGYECDFVAVDSRQPFRPERLTPKPVVQGPQTAIVVGKPGEEIWADKHGRVKVQFHWDRLGKLDEQSSCWVRVSQPWAGKNWGAVSIPRIGQEVVVDFLEGDPDRPIITGRVYNADQMPPYALPAGGMVSGFKSNSTPGGGGFNEISADDTKGKEKITIHGQYDMATTVEHDQTLAVNNNRTDTIAVDDSETVGNNQTLAVGVNQSVSIGANQTIAVGAARSLTVGAGESVSVGASKTESVAVAKALSIGGAYQVSVGGAMNESVGAVKAEEIGGAKVVTVGGAHLVAVGAVYKLSAAAVSESSKGVFKIKAGGVVTVEAPTIVLKAGGSKITMNSGGITIKGPKVTVKADGNVTIKGGGGVKLKGPTIGEN